MAMHQAAGQAERLTWSEICARYPDRWAVLVNITWVDPRGLKIVEADVIATFEIRRHASPTVKALVEVGCDVVCFWTGELFPKGPALHRVIQ